MAIDKDKISRRGSDGILIGVCVLAIAVGLIVWQVADLPWYTCIYAIFVVVGAYMFAISFGEESNLSFGPSRSSFFMVTGYLLLALGVVGFLGACTDLELWVLLTTFIVLVALLIIIRSSSKKG